MGSYFPLTKFYARAKLMSYLKDLWFKKFRFLIMPEDGGWTRSYVIKTWYLTLVIIVLAVVVTGLIGGWISYMAATEYNAQLQARNMRLENYREKVRRVILSSSQYGLISTDLLQELELSIDMMDSQDRPPSTLSERSGGIYVDQIYLNFLENLPTFPPVNGYVTRGLLLHELDLQVNHDGIDIAAPTGEIVAAAASGLVVFSRWTEDLGNMIIISHDDGYFTVYGHNQTNLVARRQWVERGQPIALVGDTGISHGPHLHFEIWKDARSIDPRLFIDLYRKQDVSVENDG